MILLLSLYRVENWSWEKLNNQSKVPKLIWAEQDSNSGLSDSKTGVSFFLRDEKKNKSCTNSDTHKTNYIWDLGKPVLQPEENAIAFKYKQVSCHYDANNKNDFSKFISI